MQKARRLPKVAYLTDGYISHSVAAAGYVSALRSLGCYVDDVRDAEVLIVHRDFGRMLSTLRALPTRADLYCIGLLVWEADRLGKELEPAVRALDEVWTPTLFCARAFVPLHRRVFAMPHVVPKAPTIDPTAAGEVAQWLDHPGPTYDVLCLSAPNNRRKNLAGLVAAIARVAQRIPSVRLVCKLGWQNAALKVFREPHSVFIEGSCSAAHMQALLARADLVASGAHSEGWGLLLSDAMAAGVPVVATRHGGSLSFMNDANAYLVDGVRTAIRASPLDAFPAGAVWMDPSPRCLEDQIATAHAERHSAKQAAKLAQAKRDVGLYSSRHLKVLLASRLRQVACQLGL